MESINSAAVGSSTSARQFLRFEGALLFMLSIFVYYHFQGPWWLFALLILSPDIAILGYMISPKIGALLYNTFHSEVGPIVLGVASFAVSAPLLFNLSLIWFCHINFDRMLGIGLKTSDSFEETHLGLSPFAKK